MNSTSEVYLFLSGEQYLSIGWLVEGGTKDIQIVRVMLRIRNSYCQLSLSRRSLRTYVLVMLALYPDLQPCNNNHEKVRECADSNRIILWWVPNETQQA